MNKQQLIHNINTTSSGTIASAIGKTSYRDIEKACYNSIVYALEKATEKEIKACVGLAGTLDFIVKHKGF